MRSRFSLQRETKQHNRQVWHSWSYSFNIPCYCSATKYMVPSDNFRLYPLGGFNWTLTALTRPL